jgi:hypothetical protein
MKNQNFDTLNLQPSQSFSMPHYTERTGGLLSHQSLTPNLLGRNLLEQQVSTKHHMVFHNQPGINQHNTLDRLTLHPAKQTNKQLNSKQGTEN